MRQLPKQAVSTAVGAGAAVTGYYGVLFGESILARKAIGMSEDRPPSADGVYGDDLPGRPIRCIVLGDSALVGYGMDAADATPPALIGFGLSHVLDTPVDIHSMAFVGARTSDLREQVNRGLSYKPDIAVIVIGTNDITHHLWASPATARPLGAAVRRLIDAGCEVVVGTCPDLGTVKPLPQPLRWVARRRSRDLARKQMMAVVAAGGRGVSMGDLLGPVFSEKYDLMFGADRFHPSAAGYASMVSVLVPSMAAAMRERAEAQSVTASVAHLPRDLMSLDEAADEAGRQSGTEVSQQGRWASALRRRRAS
jgi:lysophospholipase L1-like esterase